MATMFPKVAAAHMARTVPLCDVAELQPGQMLILRPSGVWARAGNGIVRVTTNTELAVAKKRLVAAAHQARSPNYIASEYIVEPLLWHGLKMHLRMYWLVVAGVAEAGVAFRTKLWTKGKILTAAKPYEKANFADKDIHDSHVKTTPRNIFFPDDLDSVDDEAKTKIFEQMRIILEEHVAEILRPHAKPYEESKLAYEVLGCDFLVTKDLRPILMEINKRIGFAEIPEADRTIYAAFTRQYFTWVFENAIHPLLLASKQSATTTDAAPIQK
jgi:hypothetical protein